MVRQSLSRLVTTATARFHQQTTTTHFKRQLSTTTTPTQATPISRWSKPTTTPLQSEFNDTTAETHITPIIDPYRIDTRLSCPWAWHKRPVDTRHLPLPRPLPPIYSDKYYVSNNRPDMQQPWQQYVRVFNIVLCSGLAVILMIYMPVEEDDFLRSARKWLLGRDTAQPTPNNTR